jgi:elongation factor P
LPTGGNMVVASQLRPGMAIRYENQVYKVMAADYHPGQGKMGGVMHARLKNLGTGTTWEHSFRSELKFDEVPLDRTPMEFLYTDAGDCYFMDPNSYEQIAISAEFLGDQANLLQQGMQVSVELLEGRAISVQFPDTLEVRIAETAPPVHGQPDSNWKPAKLESGVQIMVPPFIKTGDLVRLDVAQMRYMDRAKGAGK